MEPTVRGPAEGELLAVAGNEIVFKVGVAEMDGALGVLEYTAAPGFPGPPAHVHHRTVEGFYVLDGELTMLVGDETIAV
jgi:mannose-6-phosphate isomerase-like protein (cupin superfamily)